MNKGKIKDVTVSNYEELVAAVMPFMPDGNSSIREDLILGFNIVKDRMMAFERAKSVIATADFGDHPPASLVDPNESRFWLDQFIERRMGGKRVGMVVQWDLPNGRYQFEPYTGKLECR